MTPLSICGRAAVAIESVLQRISASRADGSTVLLLLMQIASDTWALEQRVTVSCLQLYAALFPPCIFVTIGTGTHLRTGLRSWPPPTKSTSSYARWHWHSSVCFGTSAGHAGVGVAWGDKLGWGIQCDQHVTVPSHKALQAAAASLAGDGGPRVRFGSGSCSV
jgi:hypothetical protein